ncbi:MAG: ABC transporter permease [Ruminococcus sp.]|uniref:ABC transporter permease n=1 Tax=Ruminococcus sp. TaxID=41978 RepID=UPI00287300C0|nr:ABC transporter permease [Ruminococcus sp.]MBQ3285730.1 ABC transporter permease [Ruminococcus sp.]
MLENIRLALRGIITHKMRSFLTMLGVIIGIASIIGIVSIVQGTNARLEKSLIGSGNNVVTVALSQDGSQADPSSIPISIPVVSDEKLEKIRGLSGVVSASTFRQREVWNAPVYHGNYSLSSGKVIGAGENLFDTLQYKVVKGRDFTEDEIKNGGKVTILDMKTVEALFDDDPIGQVIEIKSEPFVVVGIVKDMNAEEQDYETIDEYYNASYSGGSVYIPENTWPIILQYDEPQSVAIHVAQTSRMVFIGRRAARILNSGIETDAVSYASLSSEDSENNMKTLTDSIQLMLIGIASLSLLVGGIGVMNIMLVSVTERTAEIGLKKALGAKYRTIMYQFLTESAVLTSMGGIIGVILGIIMARIIAYAANLDFGISVPWIIISVVFSVLIGVIFGGWPALRAAKLNPIDALRRE